MDIGEPIRRFTAVPDDEEVVGPEPAQRPVPVPAKEPEREDA